MSGPQGQNTADLGGKYLTFKLAEEEYGVEILKVREIIGVMDITAVPRMPSYMKGVINLRGKVIPVVDLRLKFSLDQIEVTRIRRARIVVDVGRDIGIIVDTVSEVLDIVSDQIEPAPSLGGGLDTTFILGMGKVGEHVKILLNINQVLSAEELSDVTLAIADEAESPE